MPKHRSIRPLHIFFFTLGFGLVVLSFTLLVKPAAASPKYGTAKSDRSHVVL